MAKKKPSRRVVKSAKKVPAQTSRCLTLTVDLDGPVAIRFANGPKGLQGTIRVSNQGIVFIKPNAKKVPERPIPWSMLFALNSIQEG